ncbi:alpha/beta fold hydrolase [Candidatus Xianfuyuplasma coldseepsis]|uniref:Alpha/beta hydrolase n=1 Tax=Candidatus Xianfuyuplasma coldseepsis TaxID=2782163 RepID=A0A7L7KUQ4_9MOLU|nr:alpha/beta hydrolase [Xianfuyuplasma coldseepsis]QMS85976.1 alpha/beta hydrolase [Xianfuyuplasma coldseepsis]
MSIFEYKKYRIYYTIDGANKTDAIPVIILNGIMMSTVSWDAFIPAFTEHHPVIRYDMLDQGQSTKMNTTYTQELQVEILHHLLMYLKIKEVNIVGISYGASVALQYAAKYPKTVQHLVVANAVAKTSPWLKAIGDGWNEVAKSRNGLAYYNITIPYIYSPQFYTKEIAWMEQRKEMLIPLFSNPSFLDAMIRLTVSAETHNTIDVLDKITAHTLILSGDMDCLTPVYEQEILHQRIADSKLVVLPQCGHASMYEQPDLFTSIVLGFINHKDKPSIV